LRLRKVVLHATPKEKALDLTIPHTLLLRADEVIQLLTGA